MTYDHWGIVPGRQSPSAGRLTVGQNSNMYYIYILRSLKDGNHYVGLTSDIDKRLEYHNSGRVRSTKHRTPFVVIHKEAFDNRVTARKREKYLKSYKGSKEKESTIKSIDI